MNTCKNCHVPTIISRDQTWNDDGTITLTTINNFRMVLLEVPLLNELVTRLEAVGGPTVKELMTEGSRRGAYSYANGLLKGPLRFVVRHTTTGARIAYSKLMDSAWALGLGKIFLESYEHHQRLTGKVYNPFNLPLLTGIVHGSYEAIEGLSSKSSWTQKGQFSEVSIWTDKGAPAIEKAPDVVMLDRTKATIKRERCSNCHLPKDVARFKWRSEKGDIEDERTGTRMVMIGLTDMGHVFTTLDKTVGPTVNETIRAVNFEYGQQMVKKGFVGSLDDLCTDLAAKGLSYVSVRRDAEETVLLVQNHYHKDFILGRCLGVHEALMGKGYKTDIKDNGVGTVTLKLTK